jgi:hypothetical protein
VLVVGDEAGFSGGGSVGDFYQAIQANALAVGFFLEGFPGGVGADGAAEFHLAAQCSEVESDISGATQPAFFPL